jgi:hypothetical protein
MRGAYKIPTGDWDSHDSLVDVTEIYLRPEELQSAPFIPVPRLYTPEPLPAARFDMPSLAAFPTGSSPNVRISSRLGARDATHRVPRRTPVPLLAIGVIAAAVLGIGIGIVVAFGGGSSSPPARVVNVPVTVTPIVTRGITVTPIETPAPEH